MQDLPFHSLAQFIALGLTLVAGWILGLATAPGGGKWRKRMEREELETAAYRDRAESDIRDLNRRIREFEGRGSSAHAPAAILAASAAAAHAEPASAHDGHADHALDDHGHADHAPAPAAEHRAPAPRDAHAEDHHSVAPADDDDHGHGHAADPQHH